MYLVLMVQHNRVIHVKAFDVWDLATMYADDLVMDLRGVTNTLPDWENNEYRQVFEHNGTAIMIEPCVKPGETDDRFQCIKYGVNVR